MSRSTPLPLSLPHHYYVEGGAGWFVIRCSTMRIARQWGVAEYGRGQTRLVRCATDHDLASYTRWHGTGLSSLPLEDYPHG